MDRRLYMSINHFADRTTWAHGVVRIYAREGVALFAVLLLAGWWLGRSSTHPLVGVGRAVWAGAGALLALAVNQPIGAAIDRARPYTVIANMHLLVDAASTSLSAASRPSTNPCSTAARFPARSISPAT